MKFQRLTETETMYYVIHEKGGLFGIISRADEAVQSSLVDSKNAYKTTDLWLVIQGCNGYCTEYYSIIDAFNYCIEKETAD